MSVLFARGGPDVTITPDELAQALSQVFEALGQRERVCILPPDMTRFYSRAGDITCLAWDYYGGRVRDILPALGTHAPMTPEQLERMFPGVPHERFRVHDWRNDVVTIGEVPAEFVAEVTDGLYPKPWPCQISRLLWEGQHDLILSVGQVVPHEVVGMANHAKNLFVGTGGADGINQSHFVGAVYGMERIMGRADTPPRKILNYGFTEFCSHLPVVFVLTVIGTGDDGNLALRGLYVGDGLECFERAAALSAQVNITQLDRAPRKVVVYLDPEEFSSTWLGNKSVYRTRMAIATGGELVVLAPGVGTFGEDAEIDRLIRAYGYRTSREVLRLVEKHDDLAANLSAAAHLIHGSPEGRFTVTYCPGHLTREEIEGVGYRWADLREMSTRYSPESLSDGWNQLPDGEEIYYISNPALGLWSCPTVAQ